MYLFRCAPGELSDCCVSDGAMRRDSVLTFKTSYWLSWAFGMNLSEVN